MALINLKQIIHNIKEAYVAVSGDTEPVTYGNIADKVADMGGNDGAMTATALMFKPIVQNIEENMPITATAIKVFKQPYVKNVGQAYINTGIIPTNHRVVAEVEYTGNTSGVYGLFGYFNKTWSTCYNLSWFNDGWYFCAGNSAEQTSNAVNIMDIHTIDFNNANKEVLINGIKIGDTNGTVDISTPVAIFCRLQGSTPIPQCHCAMKLYSFKIYERESGVLVRDFVPVISNEESHNGAACLFDKIEQKYYYSSDLEYGLDVPNS